MGLLAGTHDSLTGKIRVNSKSAFDLAVSFTTGEQDFFYLHASFLQQYKESLKPFDWYWGLGLRLLNQQVLQTASNISGPKSEFLLGLRSVIGLKYNIKFLVTEIFSEVSASYNLVHSADFDESFKSPTAPLEFHGGLRYFF